MVVSRPSRWGNPYKVVAKSSGPDGWVVVRTHKPGVELGRWPTLLEATEQAVALFEAWARRSDDPGAVWIREHVHELAGKTLGCWCEIDDPCHRSVLARMADEAVAD